MFHCVQGSIFDSKMQTLVNPVNCAGVMGKGLAAEFKRRYPAMFREYQIGCQARNVRIGHPHLYKYQNGLWILNFPTKRHWRDMAYLQNIIAGLHWMSVHAKEQGITSVAFPMLGCGCGGLEPDGVKPLLETWANAHQDIEVEIYESKNDTTD